MDMRESISGEDYAYHLWLTRQAEVVVDGDGADVCLTSNGAYSVLWVDGEIALEGYSLGEVDLVAAVLRAVDSGKSPKFRAVYDTYNGSFLDPETKRRDEEIDAILEELESD